MRSVLCGVPSRGMAPAKAIANTVGACSRFRFGFTLVTGKPAHEAKNDLAKKAHEAKMDLLLVEDDIIAFDSLWRKVVKSEDDVPQLATTRMKNGEVNLWTYCDGEIDRVVYSGTVFLHVPWKVLDAIGDPWFTPRNLWFTSDGAGVWEDKGPNECGMHSDTWIYYRMWQLDIRPRVIGSVVHCLHEWNKDKCDLVTPSQIKELGFMNCEKMNL